MPVSAGDDASTNGGSPRAQFRTFLLSDIRGFSSFSALRGAEASSALTRRFGAIATEVLRASGGVIVDMTGDEVLAAFESPREAIRAAIEFQNRLIAATQEDRTLPLPAGIGLDFGEAVVIDGRWSANAINVAARLCSLAGGGEVLATAELAHVAQAMEGVTYAARSAIPVKGIPQPVRRVRIFSDELDHVAVLKSLDLSRAAPLLAAPNPGRSRRRIITAAATAVAVLSAAVVTGVILSKSDDPSVPLTANSLGSIDTASGTIRESVPVAEHPTGVAVAKDGTVWVTSSVDSVVTAYDPKTHQRTKIQVGSQPAGVAVAPDGSVWVANSADGTVSRINATSRTVVITIDVGPGPGALVADGDSIWVANTLGASISRINLASSKVTATIPVGNEPDGIAVGDGSIWVADGGGATVRRLDARTGALAASPISVGRGPRGVAFGNGAAWVANALDGTLSRIDASTGQVITIPVGSGPFAVAVDHEHVWVSNQDGNDIAVVDPAREVVSRRIKTTSAPLGIAVHGDRLWVAADGLGAVAHRGGQLTAVASGLDGVEDPPSIDPGYAFSFSLFRILTMTSDGLVTYRREGGTGGAQIVPDLAAAVPTPVNGDRTYIFRLRKGLTYSNGKPVRASDFRAGLERAFRLTGGPTNYFTSLIGGQNCAERPARCDLSHGIVADDSGGTVTYNLTGPDPEFLSQLALPVTYPVPPGTPDNVPVGGSVPGTGPYVVTSFKPAGDENPHGTLVLSRNSKFRQWSAAAQPDGFPDRIRISTGYGLASQVEAVHAGHADLMWDSPTATDAQGLQVTDPGQEHQGFRNDTAYVWLNARKAPFNNVLARRAFNFAIDRGRIVAAAGDSPFAGVVTCQLLPPNFPGYAKNCPYTVNPSSTGSWTAPDLATARDLVRRSGTSRARITLVQSSTWPRAVGDEVVRNLNSIGYRAKLRIVDASDYYDVAETDHAVQAGLIAWQSDYVAPSSFLNELLACAKATPDGANLGRACDHTLDAAITSALASQTTQALDAITRWTAVDKSATDAAIDVPINNAVQYVYLARRVGNYQSNPQWGLLVDQLWVD